MQLLAGTASDPTLNVMAGIARYRHKVFVETLGWDLVCEQGLEFDQFDRPDTRYVVAHDPGGELVGVARLLPTTRPYLLSEVFPSLMGDAPVPRSRDVWELSRFAALKFNSAASKELISSPIAIDLLHAAQACAAKRQANSLITVSPPGVERLLRKAGFRAHRAGPPMVLDGHPAPCVLDRVAADGPRASASAAFTYASVKPSGHLSI